MAYPLLGGPPVVELQRLDHLVAHFQPDLAFLLIDHADVGPFTLFGSFGLEARPARFTLSLGLSLGKDRDAASGVTASRVARA